MLITRDKHFLYTLDRIWFDRKIKSNGDILRYLRISEPVDTKWYSNVETNYTVVNDLNCDDELLFKNFNKNIRYEIRRAKKENVSTRFYYGDSLSKASNVVEEFQKAYRLCAASIDDYDLMSAYSERKINNFLENKCVMISNATKDTINVYHFYVFDNEDAVMVYSVSNFRDNVEERYLTGMANKLLHYEDMRLFKSLGVRRYDWGNISDCENFNGIDRFKLSFGGTIEKRYNCYVGHSIWGKLLVFVKTKLIKKGI